MIDSLLFAVKDTILQTSFGWDERTLDVMGDGRPPPGMANWFCAVHQETSHGDMMNALDEYFGFTLTVSLLLQGAPRERLGASGQRVTLADRGVRTLAREVGFNSRVNQLQTYLHMNWWVIGLANQNLLSMFAQAYQVDGFAEPAHWAQTTEPKFVGGDWFSCEPADKDAGLTCEVRFEGARRLQTIATYT